MGSSAKTGKFFIRGSQERKRCTFLGPKHKSAIWDRTPPHLHIKCSLYVCSRVQGSQIFKRNSIILIHSRFIEFLQFGLLQLQGGGAGGWGSIWGHRRVFLHAHMHVCTYAHMYIHVTPKNYMLRNCKWLLPWRQPCLSWLTCMGMCVHMYLWMHTCVHVHTYVYKCGTDTTHPHPHPPPTCQGGTPLKQYKFNTSWTNRDKSILFADLKSV